MSINLLRNSKVFFTTNLESVTPGDANRGHVALTGHTTNTTYEIQVLDDLSFSQTTAVETIGVNETGTQPIRGQRSFNTALNPVDFNFTTYMRPVEQRTIGVITTFSATLETSPAKTLLVYVSGTEPAWNDATNYTDEYGPNTIVVSPIPANYTTPAGITVVGRAATIIPVFGTDSAKIATYGKLVGFKLINGGAAYQTSTTGFQVIDPDSSNEPTAITIEVTAASTTGVQKVTCEESVLWNAMFAGFNPGNPGSEAIGGSGSAWVEQNGGTDPSYVRLTKSAAHQLQPFALIVIFDQNVFLLDDCSLNTATIDFGIDAIASIQWSGQARQVRRLNAPVTTYNTTNKYYEWSGTGTLNGHYKSKITDAAFLANKLSTVTLWSKIGKHDDSNTAQKSTYNSSTSPAPKKYTMPLTGGSITLTNNISYLTPAYMGSINQPVTYFTGSRSITGSLTAYLRTGSGSDNTNRFSANLFSDLMDNITQDSDPEFYLTINIGGEGNNKVELDMPGVVLTIPTVNAEQVVTTTVNFTAQGTGTGSQAGVDSEVFDILNNNEIKIRYYA